VEGATLEESLAKAMKFDFAGVLALHQGVDIVGQRNPSRSSYLLPQSADGIYGTRASKEMKETARVSLFYYLAQALMKVFHNNRPSQGRNLQSCIVRSMTHLNQPIYERPTVNILNLPYGESQNDYTNIKKHFELPASTRNFENAQEHLLGGGPTQYSQTVTGRSAILA
jgi:hypothetical protein